MSADDLKELGEIHGRVETYLRHWSERVGDLARRDSLADLIALRNAIANIYIAARRAYEVSGRV